MPKFTIQYHLARTDFVPLETIEAENMQAAAKIAGERVSRHSGEGDAILVPHSEDVIAIPRGSVMYCHVRAVLDRRRSAPVVYEEPVSEESGS